MATGKPASYQVQRLNYIIDLLIKENLQLKQIIEQQLPAEAKKINSLSAISFAEGQKNFLESDSTSAGQQTEKVLTAITSDSNQKSTEMLSSTPDRQQNENILTAITSHSDQKNKETEPFTSDSRQNQGKTTLSTSGSQQNSAETAKFTLYGKEVSLAEVQQKIADNNINTDIAGSRLRSLRVRATYASIDTSIKLLMHLARTPKNSNPALQRVTGLSAGAVSKHLNMLVRIGLVVKEKHLQYALTEKGLQLLGA